MDMDMDMEMDLEAEEGEGDDEPARPAPVNRCSSYQTKKAAPAKGRAVKSKAKAPKSNGKSSVAEPSQRDPYPLEGKYVDEDDRDAYVLIHSSHL